MEFKVGQIMNSKGSGIFGRLIRWRNGLIYGKEYNWSHSAIITNVEKDRVLVHEAVSKGFVWSYYDKKSLREQIKKRNYNVGDVKIKLKDVKKNAQKYEGRGYGFLDIFNIILYWLFGSEAKFLFTGAQNLICSEAVARILYDSSEKKIDFEKEFLIPYDLIEPAHLAQSKYIKWIK
jgi:hypothetical protein